MERRVVLALLAAGPIALLAACGSDGSTLPPTDSIAPAEQQPISTDVPTSTTVPVVDAEVARVTPILSLTYEGGFTMREVAFQNAPTILITSDGRVITLAAGQHFDRALPQHEVRTISQQGIDALFASLAESGMLRTMEYERNEFIADAATTTLVIVDGDGNEFRHEAYDLDSGGFAAEDKDDDPRGATLRSVIGSLTNDLATVVGADALGEPEVWRPGAVQVTTASMPGSAPTPASVLVWPESAGIALDDPSVLDSFECVELTDPATIDALSTASMPALFRSGAASGADDVFQVIARPAYPGRSCDE